METSALTFAQPAWFVALILVVAFGALYFWSQRRSDALIGKIVSPRLKSQLAGAVSVSRRALKAVLILTALALVIVALARPQAGYVEREVKQRGRDVIIAIDTSRSMLATDVSPTRLDRAKLLGQDLMGLIRGDRIGLIAFAGSAFLQAPLTLDESAVLGSLDELDTNVIPKGGTNIAAAIRQAQDAFGKGEGKSRALVILTDGEELDADGIAAAKKAAEDGIHIFTVGIGSGEGSLIPIRTDTGSSDFVRDANGKPVQSRLDETRLKEIAAAGDGFYVPLSPDAAREIFTRGIEPLKETENGVMTSRQAIEQYQWPLGAALILLAVWSVLGEKRRRPARAQLAVALAALALIPSARAANPLQEYQAGNYPQALQDFTKDLKSSPDSDKLQYNSGTAAYQMKDYGKAVDYFTKALLSDNSKLREDASYNLGNSLVRRGEGAQENEKKKADWKNAIQHYTEALNLDPKNKDAEENREIVKKMLADLEKQEQQKKDQEKDKDPQQKDQKDQKDQQKQDQKNDQQNKDQQNKDQKPDQQKDQNKDDQNKQDQKSGDQQKQDQKDQQNKDQQNKDQSGKGGDQKDQPKDDQKDQKDSQGKPDEQKGDQKSQDQKPQDQKPGDQKQDGAGQQPEEKKPDQQAGQPQPTPQPTPGEKKEGDLKTAGGDDKKQEPAQQGQGQPGAAAQEDKDGQMSAAQARSLLNSLKGDEEKVKLMQTTESENTLKDW